MKILVISDWIDPLIYSANLKKRMSDIDFIISCGDIQSEDYFDFIVSQLNKELFYVVGNHLKTKYYKKGSFGEYKVTFPSCFKNIHRKIIKHKKLLIMGFQGSNWYNGGPFQYKPREVFLKLLKLVPKLIMNKLLYGRFIDIFVAHAPPLGVGDGSDHCHRGIDTFNKFIKWFKPKVFLHGHIHLRGNNISRENMYYSTRVINCTGHTVVEL